MENLKPGRNDPCPCGSGKKHKKCCYENPEAYPGRAQTPTPKLPVQQEIDTLVLLFNQQRYIEAELAASSMTARFPHDSFGWKVLGAALNQMGRSADALAPMQKAAALSPGDAEAHYNLSVTLQAMNRLAEAEASYRRVLEANPDYVDAHCNLGVTLQGLGRFADAEASFQRALEISPDYAVAHYNLGITLKEMGRQTEAEASYRRALQIQPNLAQAHSNLGNLFKEQGRLDDAEASYRRVLEIYPDYAEAHTNLGVTLHGLGRLDEAEGSCRQALQLNPNLAEAHYNLGVALHGLGRLDEAEGSCRRALQLNPNLAEAHYNLGVTLHGLGRLDEAEGSCRQALQLNPNLAEAHYNLGLILHGLSRLAEAEASYRRALQLKTNYAEALTNLGMVFFDLDDLAQAAVVCQQALENDPVGGLEAALYLAILHFLGGDLVQCRSMLLASQPIMAKTVFSHSYWTYLDKLVSHHQQSNFKNDHTQNMKSLHVIGESHSLSAHGVVVRYNGQKMRCSAEWIVGCKQWHLGNSRANKFKHKFEAVMARLPRNSTILLLIGEIDCRHDEGIIKASKKYPDKTLVEVVKDTVGAYLDYVAAIGSCYGHGLIVGGVPATHIEFDGMTTLEVEQFVHLIRVFNEVLKIQTLAAGMRFLDVYALTDRCDGIADGVWHIDNHHLLPSAVVEAFDRLDIG